MRLVQPKTPGLLALLVLVAIAACKVTASDIEYWKGTERGPGKIVAVMLSDNYPIDLRTSAALALVEMERPGQEDDDGVVKLQQALQQLPQDMRGQIIDGMVPGLEALMQGTDAAQGTDERNGPPESQIRAKDAAYLLIVHASAASRERLVRAVVGWYTVDFNGRNLAGSYSAEQVVRSLGAPAATLLVDAINANMPQAALIKIAELIGQLADDAGKARAAQRLVQVELEMEADPFLGRLKDRVRAQIQEARPGQPMPEDFVTRTAETNRELFINDGALPAMKHLATQQLIAERLLAIASSTVNEGAVAERRWRALAALEGNVSRAQLGRILDLALNAQSPTRVRDYAFDRIADIRSADAIPRLWPLVQSAENQRERWRAGELVLTLGGPQVIEEFFANLPVGDTVKYEPEELAGYATRMSQMTPPPTDRVLRQLGSGDWWDRVIVLRYLERKGAAEHVARMQRLTNDSAEVQGEHWDETRSVGQVAQQAISALQERLRGGNQAQAQPPAQPPQGS